MAKPKDKGEWVGLRRAAEILGVHPATVRNWADSGKLPFRRTAGKHRRFRLQDLQNFSPESGELAPLELQIIMQSALGRTRMQIDSDSLESAPWYAAMSEESRQLLREQGRYVLKVLRDYIAERAPDADLALAVQIGKDYARCLSGDGLSLPQAMRGFTYFSDSVFNSILNFSEMRQPSNAAEWSALLRQVNTFMHTMQLSIVEYYAED